MKYIIGGAVLVIIVAAFIALIIGIAGPGDSTDETTGPATAISYVDEPSEVVFTEYGRIVAQEEYRAIRVTVSAQQRTIEILRGYDSAVEERVELSNTSNAYEAFLHALDTANFTAVRESAQEREDGICPSGRRFSFEVRANGETEQRTWSTTCSRSDGSFAGDRAMVARLFERQIPDYRDIVRGTRLR